MLTNTQIYNIHNLDTSTCIEIMHECAERLGLVSANEYSKIMCIPIRTVYQYIIDNKIKTIIIADRQFLIINDK